MTDKHTNEYRRRIQKLAAQNARLREVAESFANRSALQARRTSLDSAKNTITVFENFRQVRAPRPRSIPRPARALPAESAARDNEWFPRLQGKVEPLDPTPGWRCLTAHDAVIRVGFNLIGLDEDRAYDAIFEIEQRQIRDRDFIPVFITDLTAFELFRQRGYVFEYIPSAISDPSTSRRAERQYFRRRLELITAKWNLREIVDLSG
jgi:hypothetical protein